jgi:hypothetical protein
VTQNPGLLSPGHALTGSPTTTTYPQMWKSDDLFEIKQVRRLKQVSATKLSTAPVSHSGFQEFPRTPLTANGGQGIKAAKLASMSK